MKTSQILGFLYFTLFLSLTGAVAQISPSDTVIVLAMHGGIPNDFPKAELHRFFSLHEQGTQLPEAKQLEQKLRHWPRNQSNDPYYWGSVQLQKALQKVSGLPVILAFNEFCAPSIEEAILQAVEQRKARVVLLITPMLTPGGNHSEKDIPAAIQKAKQQIKSSGVTIQYIWPIPVEETARFFLQQIHQFNTIHK